MHSLFDLVQQFHGMMNRLWDGWLSLVQLCPWVCGTHSLRRRCLQPRGMSIRPLWEERFAENDWLKIIDYSV